MEPPEAAWSLLPSIFLNPFPEKEPRQSPESNCQLRFAIRSPMLPSRDQYSWPGGGGCAGSSAGLAKVAGKTWFWSVVADPGRHFGEGRV